jgi:hypothetical protein
MGEPAAEFAGSPYLNLFIGTASREEPRAWRCPKRYVIFSVLKILPKISPDISGFGINYEELTE